MKIGLHSVSYSGTWGGQTMLPLKDFIRKAAELGYECVEFAGKRPHASPLDLRESDRKEIKKALKEKKLELVCLASYHDWAVFYEHNDMALMEKELYYMEGIVQLAHDLGCRMVRTYTGYYKEGIPYRRQWESCINGIKESARMASKYDIVIAVQNHSCIASDPDSLLDFITEVNESNVKVCLDAPFIVSHNKPIRDTVLKYKGLMVHTHLTDFIRRDRFRYVPDTVTHEKYGTDMIAVPAGRGDIDYVEFIGALKEIGYDGALSYEMCSPIAGGGNEHNLDRCARESFEFIRALLQKE
jgi:sugar phosphate isomerase/epimerase